MARRPLIAGNWKMNGLRADGTALAEGLAAAVKSLQSPAFDMLVCPPFPLLGTVHSALDGCFIGLGGQDCHMAEKGAHTGDVSATMLADIGCDYVIVGHSERRADHGESSETVKTKAEAALAAGLTAIVCIGETLEQREAGRTLDVNKEQLQGSLPKGATAANCVIAYEPVWAIGTGKVATPEQAQEVHAAVRAELAALVGAGVADAMRILYGGSMKPGNAAELIGQADIDGGLIGGASLKVEDFMGIAAACK
ncbi:MAG: triose-phosphate isomerase [Magnetospiraceae bacterium]